MRVVGGEFRGRALSAPRGRGTRPTPEKVREAVFSILGDVEGATVLDLFAGSGAMAIEALSRGASLATMVDSSRAAIQAIQRNLDPLNVTAEIRHQRALPFLRSAQVYGRQYDLVFLDPPYSQATALGPELSAALGPVLAPSARVVVESDRRQPLRLEFRATTDKRRYGDTLIEIYRLPTDDQTG